MKWFDSLKTPTRVFLTLGTIWMIMGLAYDYVLKLFGVIFLLSGMVSLVSARRV